MKFTLDINCDNDAFFLDWRAEVARILEAQVIPRLTNGDIDPRDLTLRDTNGNAVGKAVLTL